MLKIFVNKKDLIWEHIMDGIETIKQRHDAASEKTLSSIEERSRTDFTYSIFDNPRGLWLQHYLKVLIAKTVHLCHSSILKYYDKNAFVFDDERLQSIRAFVYGYAENYLKDCHEKHCDMSFRHRKAWLVIEAVEIALFILKEDIWWRTRILKAINIWEETNPYMEGYDRYELTKEEAENLKRW